MSEKLDRSASERGDRTRFPHIAERFLPDERVCRPVALFDTYVAALQRDRTDLPADTRLVGVVRRPTRWFNAAVDENRPTLAPPGDLLDEHAEAAEAFRMDGLCAEGAHNAAWDRVEFDRRYRDHLATDADAGDAVRVLRAELAAGDDVAVVCFENTDKKRCHRTVLRDVIEREAAVGADPDDDTANGDH